MDNNTLEEILRLNDLAVREIILGVFLTRTNTEKNESSFLIEIESQSHSEIRSRILELIIQSLGSNGSLEGAIIFVEEIFNNDKLEELWQMYDINNFTEN